MIYIIQTKLLPDYFKDVQLSELAGGLDSNQMISTDDASDLTNSQDAKSRIPVTLRRPR